MDEIDYKIISILCKDARTPFRQIAKNLGIGTDAVIRRFNKLQQDGIVSGSTVVLSSKACGVQGLCGLFIKIKSGSSINKVVEQLKNTNLSDFYQTYGEYDFYADLYFKNFEEVFSLIDNLRLTKDIALIDHVIFVQQDWQLPYIIHFVTDLPIWAYPVKKE